LGKLRTEVGGEKVKIISRGIEISIAGGGEEMVHAYLFVETKPLF